MGEGVPFAGTLMLRGTVLFFIAMLFAACGVRSVENVAANNNSHTEPRIAEIREEIKAVEPFFRPMGEPQPGEWLAVYREKGQTFDEYLTEAPGKLAADRRTIYIMPLGDFKSAETRVIRSAMEYIEAFYGLPVKPLDRRRFPAKMDPDDFRLIDYPKHRQIRTGYILEEILRPTLPHDAAALIAFTNEDLYPDSSMFFVFGQASLSDRVGVWSLYRLDDGANFETFLRRTLKIAVHETGHMFAMRHCTKYECVMSGTNHLQETDSRPIDACPECMAKICWFTKTAARERYRRLLDYCTRNGLKAEAEEFRKKLAAVSSR